jgi:hypothetical protein
MWWKQLLMWVTVIYFIIGLSITAFCVHMSYHEAAVGFGDTHDHKAQKVLESRIGPLGFIFLFTFWPIALLIAFFGGGAKDVVAAEAAAAAAGGHGAPSHGAQPATAAPTETIASSQH